jgi:Mn-dependent DtxR family transcriptional regulator
MIPLFPEFSRTEQRVLWVVIKTIEENGKCTATVAELARKAGISRPTARNAIKRAIENGLLDNQFLAH